jgi:hypothetical protein
MDGRHLGSLLAAAERARKRAGAPNLDENFEMLAAQQAPLIDEGASNGTHQARTGPLPGSDRHEIRGRAMGPRGIGAGGERRGRTWSQDRPARVAGASHLRGGRPPARCDVRRRGMVDVRDEFMELDRTPDRIPGGRGLTERSRLEEADEQW